MNVKPALGFLVAAWNLLIAVAATWDIDKVISRSCGAVGVLTGVATLIYILYGIGIRKLEKKKLEKSLADQINEGHEEIDRGD